MSKRTAILSGGICFVLILFFTNQLTDNTPESDVCVPVQSLESVEQHPHPELISEPEKINGTAAEPEQKATPVESVEDRDDAMLFEIDALGGTPFDQSVTMPFD